MSKEIIIDLRKLSKYYGKARGVVDLDLSVAAGEVFGFIGPNGAGKSTTIRCMLGLIHPTGGEVRLFGREVSSNYAINAADIGYLPSEVFYYESMRVKDLLNYSASFFKGDFSERINYLAKELDLDLNKKIGSLSFGNRKKVGIVQCLLHSPKLIILDEPTSGLDPLMQQKFFDLLTIEKEKGATIFFSSHILSEVQRMCERVAIIKEGKIIKIEEIKKLMEDNYKKVILKPKEELNEAFFNFTGIQNAKHNGDEYHFLYRGDINLLIQKVSSIPMINVNIFEPDLEEIFLHYYE